MIRVVAEAGQCNQGSIDLAIKMSHWAHEAGAWAIKFQLLRPETIATEQASKYWADTLGTDTQREAFTRAGLVDYGAWREVKWACDDIGLVWFATPFDLHAVDVLEDLNVECYKVASGDITYRPLLERIAETGKPVFVSTGASSSGEIKDALNWLDGCPVTLLACTLAYPTPSCAANLARIETLKRYGCPVGYSDHTTGTETATAAAAMGATVLEKHFTHDRTADDVPDHAMALDPPALAEYVQRAELGARLRGSGELGVDVSEEAAWVGARRSIVAARDLWPLQQIKAEDLAYLRPGGGISPARYREVLGRHADRRISPGENISLKS